MRKLFRDENPTRIDGCKKFLNRYCHPMQIGTGAVFSIIGIGVTAAGVMYADGMNFLFQGAIGLPNHVSSGVDMNGTASYIQESYRGSIENAINAGWKQVPFSYCIGHYCGGKFRDNIMKIFHR